MLDIPPEDIVRKGRLQPGRMFLVDTEQGRIIEDEEIKRTVASRAPVPRNGSTSTWCTLESLPAGAALRLPSTTTRCCSGRSRSATRSRTSAC